MKEFIPNTHTQHKKLTCDWTEKKNILLHYGMLKYYVRHGMVIDKVHDLTTSKQSKWLEMFIYVNTQKRNQAVNDFENDLSKILNNAFDEKTMENVHNRIKVDFTRKDVFDKIIKQQYKLTFNGILVR